jgi:integrase
MARAARDIRLENRTNRLKLETGKRYYVAITEGLSLVYRRTGKDFGVWSVRIKDVQAGDRMVRIGPADDFQDADGETVLTFPQAQEKARALSKETKAVGPETGKLPTVAEAAAHYLGWFKEHRKSYRETEATVNAHILPTLGSHLVTELSSKVIRQWQERIATQPARKRSSKLSTKPAFREKATTGDAKRARKSTANRILTVLKAILNKAFQDGMVSDDTAWRRVKPFENADEPVTRFLTEVESTRLVNACTPDFRPLVKAALFTGCRYGELTRLLTKDVNMDTGMIYISPEAKSGKGRYIPLHPEGLDFFKTCILGKTGKDHVFLRGDGAPWGKKPPRPPAQGRLRPGQDRTGDRLPRTAPHLRQHPGPDGGGPAHHFQAARPCRYPYHQPALRPPVRQHPESRRGQAAQLRAPARNQGAGDPLIVPNTSIARRTIMSDNESHER